MFCKFHLALQEHASCMLPCKVIVYVVFWFVQRAEVHHASHSAAACKLLG